MRVLFRLPDKTPWRAGLTTDVLAEIAVPGFVMRPQLVQLSQSDHQQGRAVWGNIAPGSVVRVL